MKKNFFEVGSMYEINSMGNGIVSYQAHVLCKCTRVETKDDHDEVHGRLFSGENAAAVTINFKNMKVFNKSECTTWNIGKEAAKFSIRDTEFDKYKFKKITKETNPEYFL